MIHLDHYSHQSCPRCREFLFIVKISGTPWSLRDLDLSKVSELEYGFYISAWSPHRSWQWPASCSKQAARATPKGSAHCKGPQDHLPVIRYACFVPLSTSRKKGLFLEVKPVNVTGLRSPGHSVQKMQNNRDFTLSRFYVEPLSWSLITTLLSHHKRKVAYRFCKPLLCGERGKLPIVKIES